MHKAITVALVAVALLAACGCDKKSKSSDEDKTEPAAQPAQAKSAEQAAKGFIEAVTARDEKAAAGFLMNQEVCDSFPKEKRRGCPEYVKEVRKQLPGFIKTVPKSFKVGDVKAGKPPGAPRGAKMVSLFPKGGGRPLTLMVVEVKGKYYVGMGIKKKTPVKPKLRKKVGQRAETTGRKAPTKDPTVGSPTEHARPSSAEQPRRSAARAPRASARPSRPSRPSARQE